MKEDKTVPQLRFPEFTDAWKQRKFEDWGTFYYGKSCPKWSIDENAKTPCVRYGELYTKFGNKIDKVFSYTNIDPENLRFSTGKEVLIPRVGEDPFDYNHCTWLSIKGIAIGEMISVFNTDQDPQFSATMFNATLKNEFAKRVEGGSVTNLYFEKLKNILIYYPSLEEQKKIASFFERIDQTITLQQRKLNSLQKLKKGLLQKMFPKNGENIPEIRFPEFSDAWKQRKFGEFVERKSDSALSSTSIPSVEYEDVESETGILKKDIYVKTEFKKGVLFSDNDVLYGKLRPYLHNWLAPSFTGVAVGDWWVLSPKNCSKDFLYRLLQTLTFDVIANQTSGTKMPRADWNLVSSTAFYIPSSIEEQEKIGSLFNRIDNTITLQQRKLESLQKLKKGLLQQMFI